MEGAGSSERPITTNWHGVISQNTWIFKVKCK